VIACLALAGCGGSSSRDRLDLVLDFFPNADHAGIYAAQAGGHFRDEGLDVRIRTPSDPSVPLKLLAAGKADLAVSYEPEVLRARDKGVPVVAVAALVRVPLTSIVSLPSAGIRTPKDLRGKTVGTAGIPYQSAYLKTILDQAGVDPASVKEVNVGFNLVPAMLSKRVDATLGAFWNVEGIELQRAKRNPVVIPVDKAGVPAYDELVLVAREQDARERGPYLRAFLRAMAEGHDALRKDPAAGVDALVKANPDLDRADTEAEVHSTLPAFFPADRSKPFGWQDQGAWARYGAWMFDSKLLRSEPLPRSLTNEFLPGAGLEPSDGTS
jgi:putative hydroxymethylpyrimidine transport system substrate-binding protein